MIELINNKKNLQLTEPRITVDDKLSTESTNPVQNKVITEKIVELEQIMPIVDQTYNPYSTNAASSRVVGQVQNSMTSYVDTNIRPQSINRSPDIYTYQALVEESKFNRHFAFHTRGNSFTGATTETNLPAGQYVCFQVPGWGGIGCWNLNEMKLYFVTYNEIYDENYNPIGYNCAVYCKTDEIEATIGDIDTALDSIIALQEGLIGGASE